MEKKEEKEKNQTTDEKEKIYYTSESIIQSHVKEECLLTINNFFTRTPPCEK